MHTEFEILEALFQADDAHDLDQVASLYAADATHLYIAAGRPKQGRDRIVEGLVASAARSTPSSTSS